MAQGIGTRKTARLVRGRRDNYTRYIPRAGGHAGQMNEGLVAFPPATGAAVLLPRVRVEHVADALRAANLWA